MKTPCKGTATVTNINTHKGGKEVGCWNLDITTIYPQYICKRAELKFERSDNLPAVHLQVITPCKGTAIVTNIETDKGEKSVIF